MVEGRIVFVPHPPAFEQADVHVRVEDTTYADAEAVALARVVIPGVAPPAEPDGLAFRLDYEHEAVAGRSCSLAVLVDVDGDGVPGRGDYVSYQAVRVPAPGETALVRVRRIE
jgi:hypothetical protein